MRPSARLRRGILLAGLLLAALAVMSGSPSGAGTARAAGSPKLVFPGQYQAPLGAEEHVFQIQNAGSATTSVRADWYLANGTATAGRVISDALAPGASVDYQSSGEVPVGFRGTLVLSADQPLTGNDVVYRVIGGVRSIGGRTGQYPMPGSLSSTVSLPYVANQLDATYNTQITIANAGDATACVQLRYSFVPGAGAVPAAGRAPVTDAGTGGAGCAAGYPLAKNASMTISPVDGTGLTPYPAATANSLMAATVLSTGSGVIAVVDASLATGLHKAASYEGFLVEATQGAGVRGFTPDVGRDIAIPIALKTPEGFYSQILMSNPGTATANVTIQYRGGGATYTVTTTIPAGGVANHGAYSDDTLPVGFVGAARVVSDAPISAVVFRSKMTSAGSFVDEDLYTAVNGIPAANAANTLFMPAAYRRVGRSGGAEGTNTWLSVTVPGGGEANLQVTTESRTPSGPAGASAGCPSGTFKTAASITGSAVFYQNLDHVEGSLVVADVNNGLGSNPPCLAGGMVVHASVPVLAVMDYVNDTVDGDQEETFSVRQLNVPGAPPDSAMLYTLRTQGEGDGRCLDANALPSTVLGGNVILAECNTQGSQLWRFVASQGGTFRLTPAWPGSESCLVDVPPPTPAPTTSGPAVAGCANASGPAASWIVVPVAGGFQNLIGGSGPGRLCLEGKKPAPGDITGQPVSTMRDCGLQTGGQKWQLKPLSDAPITTASLRSITAGGPNNSIATFRNVGAKSWQRTVGTTTGLLTQTALNDTTITLSDTTAGGFVRIDLQFGTITYAATATGAGTSYDLISRSPVGPGYLVRTVMVDTGAPTPGKLYQAFAAQWLEDAANGLVGIHTYAEIGRSEWNVVLFDSARNLFLNVDLQAGKVTAGATQAAATTPLYAIAGSAY